MDDYPALNVFWSMLWFFLWIMWLFLLFKIVTDIFRDHEMSGWGKAGWLIFVILLPFLGVLVYVIARGKGMTQRDVKAAKENEAALQDYIRKTAATPAAGGSHVDELARLVELKDKGALSEAEFQQAKAKLLT
ncbi:SHOCT domain-containing protein [Streptomyces vinaceus]|uniref:SHOCT domain-containing protein n=1 Tax=Streptomyces vinaceus TaxID=1960 RepID=A0A5J6JEH6_STRVI|nr:SHOCT domain-containing protein [Streptomyces vinaceus]QEV48935.1 SHOCT domain-containing protein [Streptomyces vinaceus]GHE38622.1 membrane protein [Streptomyces vinaceus]